MTENLKNKLEKINTIITQFERKTDNISPEDLQTVENSYTLNSGTVFTSKMVADLKMWKSFENDYKLNKMGGIQLLRILLDRILNKENAAEHLTNDKFIENYVLNYEKKNCYSVKNK